MDPTPSAPHNPQPPVSALVPLNAVGPQPPDSRIPHLDLLRGFAMFGVLLVNLFEDRVDTVSDDSFIQQVNWALAGGKFYPLLTLLFGIGFALQMTRLTTRGAPAVLMYIRKSAALVGIGVAAYAALFANTILLLYGTLGLALLLFRKASARAVLIAASVLALGSVLYGPATTFVRFGFTGPQRQTQVRPPPSAAVPSEAAAMRHGSYATIVALRASGISRRLLSGEFFLNGLVFQRFALILLGLWIARLGILTQPVVDTRFLRTTLGVGLGVGLLGAALLLIPGLVGPRDFSVRFYSGLVARQVLLMLTSPPLAFAYAAGLLLLAQRSAAWRTGLAPLNLVGRTALSNFLFQYAFIFSLFWLQRWGMIGDTSPGMAVLLTVVVFAAEIMLSSWWLARFQFGPVEWLWRVVTYWSWQPMRPKHALRRAEA